MQQAQILLGFLAPGVSEPDYASGKVMSAIPRGGMAGRLSIKLRDNLGLAYSLGMLNPSRGSPGFLAAYRGTATGTLDEAEASMRGEVERFRAEGPNEAAVARAIAYVLGNLAMDRRPNARQGWYRAFFELLGDHPDRYVRTVEAGNVADVKRTAQRYLQRPTAVVVRPRP